MAKKGKYGKIIWTSEMISFLRSNHSVMTNKQLADGLGLKLSSVRTKCYELGLLRMKMEYWTDEQINFLLAYYPIMGDVEMAELFNQMYPKEKGWTKKHIEKKRRYLELKRTPCQQSQIKKRNVHQGRFSINHWKRWKDTERMQGETSVWRYDNGKPMVVIKWSGGRFFGIYDTWARINWMLHYGLIPEGMNVIHQDGNTLNCEIENLKLVTREELAKLNGASRDLSDNYLLGIMARGNENLKNLILSNSPELIDIKRNEILLKRKIKNYEQKLK